MNKILQIKKTTDVTVEAIHLWEVKKWMRVEGTDDDNVINELIKQVREGIERKCGLGLGTQTLSVIAELDGSCFELPRGPVQTITLIEQKIDSTDWDSLVEDTDYDMEVADFSQFQDYGAGVFRFTYSCGYTLSNLPYSLKNLWMKLVLAHYESRGDDGMGKIKELETELNQYKRFTNLL